MADTAILTSSTPLFRSNATNSTTAGSAPTNPAWTKTKPTGDGVIDMGQMGSADGAYSRNGLLLLPYGVGSGQNFLMTAFAWDVMKAKIAGNKDLWVAWPLAAFACTLNALHGLADTDVGLSDLGVGTITLTSGFGNANVSNEIVSPTGDFQASIVLDTKGAKLVELRFAMNSAATSANCMVRRI